jgi:hypothetical protein
MNPSPATPLSRPLRRLAAAVLCIVLVGGLLTTAAAAAIAGPVDWREVPSTEAGRQWWDTGSVRTNRDGHLSVLSRFEPSPEGERQPAPVLYVMELDCAQGLYRDTSVNGIPRWGAEWQVSGDDDLTAEVVMEVCAGGSDERPS